MNPATKRNIKIGLTVIVSMCLLYWGIEYLKGINLLKPAHLLKAIKFFSDVNLLLIIVLNSLLQE